MKTKNLIFISFLVLLFALSPYLSGQNNTKEKPYSLEKDREQVKKFSEENMIKNPSEELIKNIIDGLSSNNEDDQLQVMIFAFKVRDDRIISIVEKLLLEASSSKVRRNCAELLYKSSNSIPVLIKALNDNDNSVKLWSSFSLAYLGEKVLCYKALSDIWDESEPVRKSFILHIFVNIGTNEAVEFIRNEINNTDNSVAVSAAFALAKLEYYNEAFPVFKDGLNNTDINIRHGALTGLAFIGDKKSLDLIKETYNNDSNLYIKNTCKNFLKNYGIVEIKEK